MLLQKGSKGAAVKKWQEWLNSRNIKVTVDGDFGALTVDATNLWKKRAGLPEDGTVDGPTIQKAISLGYKETSVESLLVKKAVETPADSHTGLFKGSAIERHNAAMLSKVSPVLQQRGMVFIDAAKADGVTVQIVQGLRTFAEQDALYAKGRTKPGKRVTNAKGGFSNHNFGLALDLSPIIDDKVSWDEKLYAKFGEYADKAGLSWGGRWRSFKDLPHIELRDIPKTAVLREWYRQGGLAEVWSHFA